MASRKQIEAWRGPGELYIAYSVQYSLTPLPLEIQRLSRSGGLLLRRSRTASINIPRSLGPPLLYIIGPLHALYARHTTMVGR